MNPSLLACMLFVSLGAMDQSTPSIDQLHRESLHLAKDRNASEVQQGRWAERVAQMQRRFPNDAVSHYWEGVAVDRARDPNRDADAEHAFEKALLAETVSSTETSSDVRYRAAVLLGLIKLGQAKGGEARKLAERAIKISPKRPAAYRLLVDACFQTNQLDVAEGLIKEIVAREPAIDGEILDLYFNLLLQRGKGDELQREVRRQLTANPTSAPANYVAALTLAQRDPKSSEAERRFIIASLNGAKQQDCTIRSQDYLSRRVLDRLMSTSASDAEWAWVADMVARYEIGERRGLPADYSELPSVLEGAKRLTADDEDSRLLRDHLIASLELFSGNTEAAKESWTRVVEKWPRFVPALCRLAEVTEAEGTPIAVKQAQDLWRTADALEPENPLVRDHIRFGVELSSTADGVRIDKLDPLSPASDSGLAAGDTITKINRKELNTLKPIERLRLVRLFTGGEIKYKTAAGELMSAEVPLLLLD